MSNESALLSPSIQSTENPIADEVASSADFDDLTDD